MKPKVAIIILNWNGWKDTIECLESLYKITYKNYDVILVDNGSEDESIKKIKEYCKGKIEVKSKFFKYNLGNKPIKIIEYTREETENGSDKEREIADLPSNRKLILIRNEKNYGFAEGNNIGMRYALKTLNPDYILLLNNDTVVDKDFLKDLVKVGERNERIGIIGPKICYYDNPKKVWSAGGKINLFTGATGNIGDGDPQDNYKGIKCVDYVSGCSLLIKSKVIKKIDLIDTKYFLYFEETDWNIRAHKHGYTSAINCDVQILHKSGASVRKVKDINYYYFTRNKLILIQKHGQIIHFLTFIPLFLMRFIAQFSFNFLKGEFRKCRYMTKGLKDFITERNGIIKFQQNPTKD